MIIDNGLAALSQRMQMIERAQKSIYLETFILYPHISSRLLLQKLMAKARQGLDVRILVDKNPFASFNPFHIQELNKAGVKVKFYNSGIFLNLIKVQHRDHRKIFLIDGQEAIVGGRNIADEYFSMGEKYNFLDLDLWLLGPMAQVLEKSFLEYWNHPWSQNPRPAPKRPTPERIDLKRYSGKTYERMVDWKRQEEYQLYQWIKAGEASNKFFTRDNALAQKDLYYQQKMVNVSQHRGSCRHMVLSTNPAGQNLYHNEVGRHLYQLFLQAKQELIIESPYFIVHAPECSLFSKILGNGVKVSLLTNGLRAQKDSSVMFSSIFQNRIIFLTNKGLMTYVYRGYSLEGEADAIPQGMHVPIWGVHGKAMVIDDKTSIIGSYNLDPHSKNFNNELMM
ncbi:MAG: phospholipase D-like domain-containing protein, partial [Pseudomonadota bacterium]